MNRRRKIIIIGLIFLSFLFIYFLKFGKGEKEGEKIIISEKITLNDGGIIFEVEKNQSQTVEDFLGNQKIPLGENDQIFPGLDRKIYPNSRITIRRAKKISIAVDGKEVKGNTLQNDIYSAIWENKIALGEDDIVFPKGLSPVSSGVKIEITRVKIEEQIIKKSIDFKTVSGEDDKLSWRTKKVKQKGQKGIEEIKYKVVSHNGKEISRKILERKITQEPVTEIIVQGTYVKLGKSHSGQGTWYAFRGGMFAANPWLPMGSYVKVTNKENGKSVIVQINDRGPFGKGRIIDLDKVAFAKIAPLGAGVIDVKMEEILN